jgi:DNA-binding transcriptional regulator YiaG
MKLKMTQKILDRFDYKGCGFPVEILNAPMRNLMGEWVLDIDPQLIDRQVALELAKSHVKLTGNQVAFLRKWSGLTLRTMGESLRTSHVAVHKWEQFGNKTTNMDENTERVLRMRTMLQAGLSAIEVVTLVMDLSEKYKKVKATALKVDAEEISKAA